MRGKKTQLTRNPENLPAPARVDYYLPYDVAVAGWGCQWFRLNRVKACMTSSRRALSIRVPTDTYCVVATLAQEEGVDLNAKLNDLIRMGLGEHKSLTQALHSILRKHLLENPDEPA